MSKLYPSFVLLTLGIILGGVHQASAQCSDFTFTTTITNVTCNNASNGVIAINVTGTGAPYQYQLSQASAGGWSGVSTFTGLTAGSYPVSVKDASGCVQTVYVTVAQPTAISVAYQETDPACVSSNTGTILQSTPISGGTKPYSYNWTFNGAAFSTAANLTGLAPGTYQLVVTDANGCAASPNIVATKSTPITVTGFNANIVATGTKVDPTTTATAAIDACGSGGFVFYEQGYSDAAGTTGGAGLPASGSITSTNISTNSYQLASYTGSNALQLFSSASCLAATSGTLTFATASQASYSTIYVLGTSGSGSGVVNYQVNYTDGSTPTTGTLSFFDWATSSTQSAISGLDRIPYSTGATFANDKIFSLYEEPITIPPADGGKKVQSIAFSYNSSETGRVNLMAVTGYPANPGLAAVNVGTGTSAAASVAITSNGITSTEFCSGQTVTFTAAPTNGGNSPTYQWYLSGAAITGATSGTYTPAPVTTGKSYTVEMTSSLGCATPVTSTSNKLKMTSATSVTASVGIASSATSICQGTPVTFTATPTNGGATPTYQWQVNGANAGTDSSGFTSSDLANGAQVDVQMTSGFGCATPSPVSSSTVTMAVTSNANPTVTISASSNSVQSGTAVNFTSTVTNGGSSPTYQWYMNGVPIPGATSSTYSTSTIPNGSEFSLDLTSSASCISSPIVVSNYEDIAVTVPTPSAPALVSGTSPINNNEPPLQGTALANSTVTIYINGVSLGTTTASVGGAWTYTPGVPIPDGAHAVTVTATDGSGNISPVSPALNLTVDTTPPVQPSAPQLVSGTSPVNNNKPPLTGTAEANSTVTVYVDGTAIGTTTTNGSGTWTYTPTSPIADGSHSVTVTATDAAGNVSPVSPALSLTIDTAPVPQPSAPALVSGTSPVNNNEPPLTGTAQANTTVTVYVDGTAIGTTTANSSGVWTYTPTSPIADGSHSITVTATNAAGTVSPVSPALSLTIDTAPVPQPSIPALVSGTSPVNNNEPPLTGTAQANTTVTVYVDGTAIGTTTANGSGVWTYTPTSPIADGNHSVTVTATNAAGTVSPVSPALSLTIDTAPVPQPSAPALVSGTSPVNNNEPPLTGTAQANTTVTVYVDGTAIGTTTTNSSGTWTYTPTSPIADGSHSITVTATNAAGTVSPVSPALSLTIDTATVPQPSVPALVSGTSPININEPPLTGNAQANTTVTVYVDGTAIGTTTANSSGVWTYTPTSPIADGSHSITVTATNTVGTVSPVSPALSLTIDTAPVPQPSAPQLVSGTSPVNNNEPPLTGTAQANTTVTVYVDGTAIGTTTTNSSGTWTYTPTSPIADGSHSITVTATNAAGTVSSVSPALSLTIDTAPVPQPSAPALVSGTSPININEPPLTGTAQANTTVTVYVDGTAIGTTTTNSSGVWAYTPTSPIADGSHSITVTATNAAGTVSPVSPALSLTIDTAPVPQPSVPALVSGTSPVNNNEPPLTGTAQANTTVIVYVDGTAIGTTTANSSGVWTYTPTSPIADGNHSVTVTATNAAGTVSPVSPALSLTIDTAPVPQPSAPQLVSGTSPVNNNEPPLTGTAQANTTVTVYVDGTAIGTTTTNSSGVWTYTPTSPIADGSHSITVTATNAAGTVSPVSPALSLTIDTAPVPQPSAPALVSGTSPININEPPLTGTAQANTTVTVYVEGTAIGTTTANSSGVWTYTPTSPIADGSHSITVTATNAAGTVSPVSPALSLTIDTAPVPQPSTPALVSGTSPVNNNEPPLTGTAQANTTVTVYVDGTSIGTTTTNASGVWTYTPTSAIAEGSHSITVTATNAAGTVSPVSPALSLTIDTAPLPQPSAPALVSGTSPVNNNEPPLTGTAPANTTVTVYVDGTAIGTTTTNSSGTWTYTPTSAIADGSHSITVTATNVAGTVSPVSPALSLTIDTAPVPQPSAPALVSGTSPVNNNEPPLTGTAQANTTVTVYVDGTAIGTTTTNSSGTWIYTPTSAIADGSHSITVTATNAAGTVSPVSPALSLTIDTAPVPQPSAPALVSGTSPVNNNEPPLTGTAEANTTVTVYVDGTAIGTTTTNSSGTWTYTPTSAIADGSHSITVTATNAAGTVSPVSPALSLTIDTAPMPQPSAPVLVSGTSPVNNNEPPLTGTAQANTTVTVYVDGTAIGTTTANSSGVWTYTPTSPIAEGPHSITVTATNAAGTVSAVSPALSLTIDTAPVPQPSAPALVSGTSPVNNNEPPLTGTAQANTTVTVYVDGTAIGTTTTNASGVWTYTPTSAIADGSHSITVTATNAAGTVSPVSPALSLTIDTAPVPQPSAPALVSGTSPVNNNEPPLTGTAQANTTVTVYVDGTAIGTTTANSSGVWTYTPASAIADGPHSITVTATNAAGTVSAVSPALSLTIDTAPVPQPSAPALVSGTSPVNNNEPPLTGTAQANTTVTVYVDGTAIGTTTTNSSGVWTYTPASAIADGPHSITVTATNAAGTVSPVSPALSLTIDTAPVPQPSAPALVSGSSPVNNNEPPLTGTAQANTTVTVYVDGTAIGTTTTNASGVWTYTPTSAIADGSHSITVTATNAAGTVSPVSPALSLTIDTAPVPQPSAPALVSGTSPVNNNEPPLTGTAQANTTVTVYVDGTAIGTTTANSSGVWTYTPASAIADGPHSITVTATNAAGTVSPVSPALSLTIDTAPVPQPSAPALVSGTSPVNNNEPPLTGTAQANTTVTVYVDGTAIGTTTTNASGVWTYTPTSVIADGPHSITVTATNAAGTVSPVSPALSLTIDTAPVPQPSAPALVSGTSPVNNNEPPLTGTAQANTTVTVYVDGTAIGTTTTNASGTWTYTPTSAIADGSHSITVTATNAAGTVSPVSPALSLTIDTAPVPQPSAPQLVSGSSPVNNNEPPLTGTAQANTTVTVYVDGTAIGTTTTNASGTWTYTPTSAIADGPHSITVTATNAAGTVSAVSPALSLTIDTAPVPQPSAPALVSGTSPVNNNEPPLTGTAQANTTVTVYVDGTAIGTTTANSSGVWTYTPTSAIADGPHSITVTATNAAGTVSAVSPALSLTIDTAPVPQPSAPALVSGTSPVNNNEPPLTGTAQANTTVTVYVDGTAIGTTTTNSSGVWIYTPTSAIADGSHSITVTATNAAGTVSPVSPALSLTIDTAPVPQPSAPVLVSGTSPVNNNEPPLTGTAQANTTVTVYVDGTAIGTTTTNSSGTWTYTPTSAIADGSHSITVTATNAAGTVSPVSPALSLTIDTAPVPQPPAPQLVSGTSPVNTSEPALKGTAEPHSTVTIYVDGIAVGTITADASGNWTYTPTAPIADGDHSITVTATDAAGNVSPVSPALSLTINTSAVPQPPAPQLVSGTSPVNNNEPPLKGTAQPNSTVTIYVDGIAIGTTTTDASGNWTYTPTAPIADGNHSITVTATDAAGSVSAVSPALNLTIDTTPPATPPAPVLVGGNGGNINTTTPTITGSAEPGSTVTIYDGGVAVGTTTANASGNYTYTFNPALSQGSQTITVSATDAAGNASGQSPATKIVVNTTPPTVTLSATVQQSSVPFTVTITFSEPVSGFDTSFISLTNGSLSNLMEVSPGIYTVVVTPLYAKPITMIVDQGAAIDSAGNASLASNTLTVQGVLGSGISAVYPVPANNVLNIQFSGSVDPEGHILMVNMAGQYVLDQEATLQNRMVTLDVSHLAPGAYALIVKTQNYTYTTKIIIAR